MKRVLYPSETSVPEGHATIAQRFNVGGLAGKDNLVPKGRLRALRHMPRQIHCLWRNTAFHSKLVSELSAVPSGLMVPLALVPNVETLGYCQESLRDEDEMLVALDLELCAPPLLTGYENQWFGMDFQLFVTQTPSVPTKVCDKVLWKRETPVGSQSARDIQRLWGLGCIRRVIGPPSG